MMSGVRLFLFGPIGLLAVASMHAEMHQRAGCKQHKGQNREHVGAMLFDEVVTHKRNCRKQDVAPGCLGHGNCCLHGDASRSVEGKLPIESDMRYPVYCVFPAAFVGRAADSDAYEKR
jgi:hypothetical protein